MAFWNKDKGETTYKGSYNLCPVISGTDTNPDSQYREGTVTIPNGSLNDNGNAVPSGETIRKALGAKHGVEWHRITVLGFHKL